MTIISRLEAVDEMFGRFNTVWNSAAVTTLVGYVPQVFWQGKEEPAKPDYSKYFCRVSQQTVLEAQSTLAVDCGALGQKRFTVDGLLMIQIFCPKTDSRAWEIGGQLARIARDRYRMNVADDVIVYRRARIQELSPEIDCLRFNVITEYEYDELG